MFSLIFLGGNYFCGSLEKSQKLEPAKISCQTVSLVYLNFFCFVDSLSLYLSKTIKKNSPVRRRKASVHLKFSLIACNHPLSCNQSGAQIEPNWFDMDRVFKRRKGSINLIQLFELSQKGRLYTCQLVHKVFIPEVIYSARNGLLMAFFFPGGAPHNELYGEAPRERGTFFRLQVFKRVEISLAEVYETVGKCVISVSKKVQKDQARDHVYLSQQENILCIARSYTFFHLYCYLGIFVNISGQLTCFIYIKVTTASV